ncbi:HK97 gp10 family phage protein [Agrobacterium radiobacter]
MDNDGGLSRIQQRMMAIPKAVRDGVRPAMERAANDIVAIAKTLVPVDDGVLRDSIGWTWGKAPAGSIALATAGSGELTITIFAGNDEAFYARFVEFGTAGGVLGQRRESGKKGKGKKFARTHPGSSAQPFFYPAYRLGKKRAVSQIKRAISKSVRDNWGSRK